MIIDAFTFYNEYDILEKRLTYLKNTVDIHILVEANITFSGNPKPWNFLKNRKQFTPWLDRIIYFPIIIDSSNLNYTNKLTHTDYNSAQWQTEFKQRNHITESLSAFDDHDLFIMGDVDEFPSKSAILASADMINNKQVDAIGFEQQMFYYNLKQRQAAPWVGSVMSSIKYARQHKTQWMRDMRDNIPRIFSGGWHCSYFGDVNTIQNKIQNFAHSELNNETYTNPAHIKQRMDAGLDLFDRGNKFIPFDAESELPIDFLSLWPKEIWKRTS